MLDLDGDGYAAVIVGQPEAASGRGRAHIYLGGAAGLGGTIALSLTGRDLAGARFGYAIAGGADVDPDGRYGAVVAHLGDINDDGFSDFVVGAPIAFSVGRYVPMGSTSPTSSVFIYSRADRTGFGQSIAGIW